MPDEAIVRSLPSLARKTPTAPRPPARVAMKATLPSSFMVGSDLKLDEGVGTCGKDGQSVPVGVGLPTIKINRLTVGGTKA